MKKLLLNFFLVRKTSVSSQLDWARDLTSPENINVKIQSNLLRNFILSELSLKSCNFCDLIEY